MTVALHKCGRWGSAWVTIWETAHDPPIVLCCLLRGVILPTTGVPRISLRLLGFLESLVPVITLTLKPILSFRCGFFVNVQLANDLIHSTTKRRRAFDEVSFTSIWVTVSTRCR